MAAVGIARRRTDPPPSVDWADEVSVLAWIEHVRWAAFFNGARGDEISKIEAAALVAALRSHAQQP